MKQKFFRSENVIFTISMFLFCLFLPSQNCPAQTATELVTRAKAAIEKKDYISALNDLNAAIKLDPGDPVAYYRRGNIYREQKDFEKAISDYTKTIELDPKFANTYYYRGLAYKRISTPDWKSALADFTKFIELQPQDKDGYYERGVAELELEMWNESERDFGKAYELGERDRYLFNNLAYVQLKMKQYVWAAVNARLALEIDPQDETAKTNLKAALANREKPFDGMLAKEMIEKVGANDLQGAIELMNRGAEVNATIYYNGLEKMTPLHIAAMRNNFQLVRALLAVGANANEKNINGTTPLHFAATYSENYGNKTEIVKLLLKNGAKVNLADSGGETPIVGAIVYSYDELVDLLIKAGANVNIKYKAAELTPLMTAIQSGSDQTVRRVLAGGGDPNAANNMGFTPLLYAVWKNGYGLTKAWLLLKAGARATDIVEGENTKNYLSALAVVRRIAAFSKNSPEAKLFDAVADNNPSELSVLLASNNSIDKTLLDYLLVMSVGNDNVPMMQSLIAKGADINYQMSDDNVLTIAKNRKKNAAYVFLKNNTDKVPETDTTAQNEAKIAELLNNAASSMRFATANLGKGLEQRDAGREKAIWCLSINEAANNVNYALKFIKQAQTVFTLKYKAVLEQHKLDAEKSLKEAMSYGCPISFGQ